MLSPKKPVDERLDGLSPSIALPAFTAASTAASTKEGSTPSSNGEQRSEQQDRVDARPAFAYKINVLQIQPKRELIQRKRRTHAIKHTHQTTGEKGRIVAPVTNFT